jgi:hypothetical protein
MARAAYDAIAEPALMAQVKSDFLANVPNPGDPLR